MKNLIVLIVFLSLTSRCCAQKYIISENDSTCTTEFHNGNEWACMAYKGVHVGISCHKEDDSYGEYYQIELKLENKTGDDLLFDPVYVQAYVLNKNSKMNALKVYTFEDFRKVISNKNGYLKLSNVLGAFGEAFEKKTVPYTLSGNVYCMEKTTYNYSKAARANADASTRNQIIERNANDYMAEMERFYLKKNTIHDGDSFYGYMNIKRKKGAILNVVVPIGDDKYTFQWDLSQK